MVSIEGVDYSYARPSAAAVKAADKKFVVRYITAPGAQNKGISALEFSQLHSAGIEVAVVYEGGTADMKKGKSQGVADAKAAQANLKAINGLNDNLPVYFACDFDAAPEDQKAINAYLEGAATVIGKNRVGVYGSYYVCKRAKAAGVVTWLWQTYAWSGGQVLAGIHLYQYNNGVSLGGGTVDLCRALQTEYGQHGVAVEAKPAPKPITVPVAVPVATPKPVDPIADQRADAAEDNADFDATAFKGLYYFKGTESPDVYVYDPIHGKKRHVTAPEWAIVKGYGHNVVYTITQTDADKIALGA